MSFFTQDKGRLPKALVIGILLTAAITGILMCAAAAALSFLQGVPYGILGYVTAAITAIATFFGAYIAAAIAKSRGLLIGLLIAAVILLLILAVGFSMKNAEIGILTAIRSAAVLSVGALGGIKGVNRKERIRIK